ncbi:MAG: hypothetical protein AMXMBFR6_22060 [Betaproteobacteria bacterium]
MFGLNWRSCFIGCVIGSSLFGAALAQAQAYPNRPLRMIVPQGAGGGTDILARFVAQKVSEGFGQQVVIENRPGAGGIIGVEAAAKAPADGYTLMIGSNTTMAANVGLYAKLPFDPVRDFTPLAMAAAAHFVIAVHPSVPATNMAELIALARSKPGQLNVGFGTSSAQICGEMLKSMAGMPVTMVPYRSSPQALNDLLAGQVQMICEPLATSAPHAKAGKLKLLAIASPKRSVLAPELAPVSDTVPGFDYVAWVAFYAPAGMPRDVHARLSGEIFKILSNPDNIEKIKAIGGFEPMPAGPDELARVQKADIVRLTKIIKEAGIKAE